MLCRPKEKTMAIIPPHMTEEEFLSVLKAIVVHCRLNAPQRKPYSEDAFSRAFAREGHFNGGPGFIRWNDSEKTGPIGPLCAATYFLTAKEYKAEEWRKAANAIGLPMKLAHSIMKACELSLDRDVALYRRLLDACSLPRGENGEDEEDIEHARRRSA